MPEHMVYALGGLTDPDFEMIINLFGIIVSQYGVYGLEIIYSQDFVFKSAADGAGYVFTYIEPIMCNDATAKKVQTFISAAKQAKCLLDEGMSRKQLLKYVSLEGREKFWNHWPVPLKN